MNGIRSLLSVRRGLLRSYGTEEATQMWLDRTKGIIFDSAPSRIEVEADTKAFMLSTDPVKGVPDSWRRALAYLKFASRLYVTDAVPFLRKYLRLIDVFGREVPLPIRQLYLYSTADTMVPYEGLDNFIEEQKAKGSEVTVHRFTDSAHVDHFRMHPKEYEDAIKTFFNQLQRS